MRTSFDAIAELARDVAQAREWVKEPPPRRRLGEMILAQVAEECATLRWLAAHDDAAGSMARGRLASLVEAGVIEPAEATPCPGDAPPAPPRPPAPPPPVHLYRPEPDPAPVPREEPRFALQAPAEAKPPATDCARCGLPWADSSGGKRRGTITNLVDNAKAAGWEEIRRYGSRRLYCPECAYAIREREVVRGKRR